MTNIYKIIKKARFGLFLYNYFIDICGLILLKLMKLQTSFALLLIAATTLFISCNDTLDKLGLSVQPDNDKVYVGTDTLVLTSKTVKVDSVYSKTKYPILGEYIDPIFGSIKSDYIGEFYYPETMEFKKDAVIDSVRLTVSYTSMLGDSLAPMQLAVHEVIKELPKGKKYTNFNPEEYSDMTKTLGLKTFTGKNNTYRTETYYSGTSIQEIKVYEINAPLPIEIGQSFLDEYKKPDHGALKDSETFRELFPGLYVTTNFGSSTILNVNLTSLKVFYSYLDKNGSSQKTDTIRTSEWRLNITPEVTQINHVENDDNLHLTPSEDGSYLKSPAGVNTELYIPISELTSILSSGALNQAKLTVHTLANSIQDDRVKLSPPQSLLLIQKDSIKTFFENGKLPDNITSFVATLDKNTQSYNFGNVAALINHYNKLHKEDNTKPLDQVFHIIPVDVSYTATQSGSQVPSAIYNQMKPTATIISNNPKKLKLDIIYSSFL